MPRVFKRTWKDSKSGQSRKTRNYYGKVRDAQGVIQRVKLCSDRTASQQMLNDMVRRAERQEAGIVDPFEEHRTRRLSDHLNDFRAYLRSKNDTEKHVEKVVSYVGRIIEACGFRFMADFNANRVAAYLLDRRQPEAVARVSLRQAADILVQTAGLQNSPLPHLKRLRKRLPKPALAVSQGFPALWDWSEIRPHLAREFECTLPRECPLPAKPGMSLAASNDYLTCLKNFANWLVRSRRMPDNPFAHLSRLNVETDRRRVRRAAAPKDFARLLSAATSAKPFRGLSGPDRVMLYLVATMTGFRASELSSLTTSSLDLEGDPATITVQAGYSKRRRTDTRPLRADLALMLGDWIQARRQAEAATSSQEEASILAFDPSRNRAVRPSDSKQKLWPGSWPGKAAEMLRGDLEAAGVPVEDSAGHVLDFHSLRHTFGTNLALAGVAPKIAQELMRHSDINLTMGTYSHVGLYDLNAAVDSLPSIPDFHPTESATGTAGPESGEIYWHQNWHHEGEIRGDSVKSIENSPASDPINAEPRNPLPEQGFEADCEPLTAHEKRATGETRTHDLRFTKASLCQLSYGG